MRKVDLDPGMGIPLAHGEIAPVFVPFRRQESCHQPSGDPYSPQHHDHGGRVMFAVPGFSYKKKFLEGRTERGRVSFKAVAIIFQEMLLDRQRLSEWGRGLLDDAMRQVCNLLRPHGNLKVMGTD